MKALQRVGYLVDRFAPKTAARITGWLTVRAFEASMREQRKAQAERRLERDRERWL